MVVLQIDSSHFGSLIKRKMSTFGEAPSKPFTKVFWKRPPEGDMKVNFDGSYIYGKSSTAGFVVRDSDGRICLAGGVRVMDDYDIGAEMHQPITGNEEQPSPIIVGKQELVFAAEISGAICGMQAVKDHYPFSKRIWLEGDSLKVVKYLKSVLKSSCPPTAPCWQ